MEKFDVVVIGAGPGGYPAAIRAAQLGASVAVVEKEALGGTCLNWGCIATKLLIACSDFYEAMRHAGTFGLKTEGVAFDYAAMVARKNQVTGKLRSGVDALLKSNGVRVFQGQGAFLGRNRIAVSANNVETQIEAGATIIATGSCSAMPGFLPRHPRVVESRAFLDRTELPKSVIVLGGGVIGCEFACLLGQLGVKTTVVEMLDNILLPLDADLRTELRKKMEGTLGIRILTGKPLEKIAADSAGVSGLFGGERVEADLLLAAVGRVPFTEGLAVEKAGLERTKAGHIPVDAHCRTRAATVFAIGDVTEGVQLAHRATDQGIVAAENACGKIRSAIDPLIPSCYFTSPEIGSVGLTEQEARQKNLAVKVGKFPFAALGKAVVSGHTEGFVKWIADANTGRLLGAHAIGAHATDLIAEATLAVRSELTVKELAHTIHAHPTLPEAWMEAAHAVDNTCIHLPVRSKPKQTTP